MTCPHQTKGGAGFVCCSIGAYGGRPSLGTCAVCKGEKPAFVDNRSTGGGGCSGCGGKSMTDLAADPRAMEAALAE